MQLLLNSNLKTETVKRSICQKEKKYSKLNSNWIIIGGAIIGYHLKNLCIKQVFLLIILLKQNFK